PDADVPEYLLEEPVAHLARCHLVAGAAGPRARVGAEQHGDGGLVDADGLQRRRRVLVGDRVADVDLFDAGDRDDVARIGPLDLDALQAVPAVEPRDLARQLRALGATERVLATRQQRAGVDAA